MDARGLAFTTRQRTVSPTSSVRRSECGQLLPFSTTASPHGASRARGASPIA